MDWQTWHDDYDRPVDPRVGFCAQLCATGGTVIWTRGRDAPDRVPLILNESSST
jgi:hypothetical protein